MIWDLELTTGPIHFRSTKEQQNAANQAPPTLLCHVAARFQKQSNWNLLSSWLQLLASSHWYVAAYCTDNDEWGLIFRNVGSTPAKNTALKRDGPWLNIGRFEHFWRGMTNLRSYDSLMLTPWPPWPPSFCAANIRGVWPVTSRTSTSRPSAMKPVNSVNSVNSKNCELLPASEMTIFSYRKHT